MTPFQAFLLALLQGITEFLPISSSAHLILLPYVLGWEAHHLRFDVVTNAGTLLAAVVYFRRDLWAAIREVRSGRPGSDHHPGLARAVLVASVPVLAVGWAFYDWFATVARHPVLIAATSIGFGLLLWWADRAAAHVRHLGEVTWRDSVWIGLAQAVALVPGTSRSGVTITAGLALGLTRTAAARFSFLLAVPVGVLALSRDAVALARGGLPAEETWALAIGFATSAVSAYLVIGWLLAWLKRSGMTPFVVYRVLVGVVILALVWSR